MSSCLEFWRNRQISDQPSIMERIEKHKHVSVALLLACARCL